MLYSLSVVVVVVVVVALIVAQPVALMMLMMMMVILVRRMLLLLLLFFVQRMLRVLGFFGGIEVDSLVDVITAGAPSVSAIAGAEPMRFPRHVDDLFLQVDGGLRILLLILVLVVVEMVVVLLLLLLMMIRLRLGRSGIVGSERSECRKVIRLMHVR